MFEQTMLTVAHSIYEDRLIEVQFAWQLAEAYTTQEPRAPQCVSRIRARIAQRLTALAAQLAPTLSGAPAPRSATPTVS